MSKNNKENQELQNNDEAKTSEIEKKMKIQK